MATTTILDSGLPGNSRSGANSNRRPGVPTYLEQVVYTVPAAPDSPGAYRYDPDSTDSTVPDLDPRSPRYEPPHLRHRPGDTWIIDRQRPRDPLDPGPYGSPGWFADHRTGRHRRGELPDPSPETEPSGQRPSGSTPERAEKPRPAPGRSGDEPPRPLRGSPFGTNDDGYRHYFGKLREEAWSRFLVESKELHRAHLVQGSAADDSRLRFWKTTKTLLFRMIGLTIADKGTQGRQELFEVGPMRERMAGEASLPIGIDRQRIERSAPGEQTRTAVGTAKVERSSPLAGTPPQGVHRTSPIGPYIGLWERHFDATRLFREAVAL
ncbi:hypothetical protein LO763_01475 [Glycomyces sp. A-F 0318]|uniref:hypothetical protein n=1 Tax=Glycomyces amatae TaxID=2881355 RepID=UPI001E37C9BF|nr:hypothetical protein [Glycomyces amatae]MCD0442295.1 hypothetical protein [Glycomyces amatae]